MKRRENKGTTEANGDEDVSHEKDDKTINIQNICDFSPLSFILKKISLFFLNFPFLFFLFLIFFSFLHS